MQYETVILELLTRIKRLEEQVEELKQVCDHFQALSNQADAANLTEDGVKQQKTGGTSYQKVTDEMVELCYLCGKKAHAGENIPELADQIVNETGMNRSSAIMYLYVVNGMLEGSVYKRAISGKATQKYLDMIFNEYGSNALKKAIKAVRLHMNYRRECGLPVDSLDKICREYEQRV